MGIKHSVIASTFADLGDVERFKKWYAIYKRQGMTDAAAEQAAFKKGDNGIGYFGMVTATEDQAMCALPPETMLDTWGSISGAKHKPISVSYKDRSCVCIVADRMPHLANIKTDARIDLNPGAVKALNIPKDGMVRVIWETV